MAQKLFCIEIEVRIMSCWIDQYLKSTLGRQWLQRLTIVSVALALIGCSGSPYPLATVSGLVTLDDKPLVGARVGFQPRAQGGSVNAGPGSYAKTDEKGRFTLQTLDGTNGAVVGQHRVRITTHTEDEQGRIIRQEEVPLKYLRKEPLSFEVTESGTEAADFSLSTQ